jgi:response regulator RpfG family c-di-GMP phosphodiesterase
MVETVKEIKSDTPIRILVVDDEENILRTLKRLLTDEEFDVITSTSGKDALKILSNDPEIALIISDQRMPGLTGVDFLEQAKKLAPDTARIILTGYADINTAIDGINRGEAYRYITKPWDKNELVQIVNDAVLKFVLIKDNQKLTTTVKKQNEELEKWNSQLKSLVREQTIEIKKQNEELGKLNENLKENFNNTILAFSGMLELRDKGAGSHSKRVAELSEKIAGKMSLSESEIETIIVASLLHDIGKIGIPDVLLMIEMEKMDTEEQKEYMQHPVRGQAAIVSVENLRKAGILIRHHHEWYNGKGFPDRLAGEKIPLGSRIIAVADFFERTIANLNGDNVIEISLNHVRDALGRRFDPEIYPFLDASVKELYSKTSTKTHTGEKELSIDDIRPGMILSRDVKSGTGLLLLGKGVILSEKSIEALSHSHRLDPSKNGIFVLA